MNAEHCKELLSDYLDGVLAPIEKGRVKRHLAACGECRSEYDELSHVSKLVAALPRHPLPEGFRRRLDAKRRDQAAAAAAEGSGPWLPFPARMTAFAMTGMLVCFVFFQQVRYRLAPAILPEATTASRMDEKAEEAFGTDLEASRQEYLARRQGAGGKGAGGWAGLADGGAAPAEADENGPAPKMNKEKAAAGRSAALLASRGSELALAAPSRAELKGGAPAGADKNGEARGFSNDSQQQYLEAERKRLGIQEVLPRGAPQPEAPGLGDMPQPPEQAWEGIPQQPMGREEAMTAMRKMTRNLQGMNEQYQWKKSPSVPLDRGTTPRLIGNGGSGGSRPLFTAGGPSGQARVTPAEEGSVAYTGVNAERKLAARRQAPKSVSAPEAPAPAKPAADDAASAASAAAAPEPPAAEPTPAAVAAPAPAKARALVWTGEWSAREGGMGSAGAAVIRESGHWADMFSRLHFAPSLPAVDFDKQMAVGVFADSSPDAVREIRIASIQEADGKLVVRYRVSTVPGGGPAAAKGSAPYHIVVVPRSDLPHSFVQVP